MKKSIRGEIILFDSEISFNKQNKQQINFIANKQQINLMNGQ